MIKDIKRIDLHGNEYYQESVICDRCKRILAPEDYYYTFERTSWRPVKMKPNCGYGFLAGTNEPWHICQKCHDKVVAELKGETCSNSIFTPLEDRSTEELLKFRWSHVCSVETASEIDKILKERKFSVLINKRGNYEKTEGRK